MRAREPASFWHENLVAVFILHKALVHAFVTSRVDYCNSLLYGLPASHLNKVQRVLNAAARLVCRAPRYCRITPLLYELHWLPVRQRISFKILPFVFKAIYGFAPTYLRELVSIKRSGNYNLTSSSDGLLLATPTYRFFSVNNLGGPLRTHMFTCDWCILIHFGCFCVARFLAFDRPVSGNNRSVFFEDFSDPSFSYLMSASCPPQKFHSSSRFRYSEQSRVILSFVFAVQAGRARCIVICINPTHTQMIRTEQKNPFEVCKCAGRYNEFGCMLNLVLVVVLVVECKGLYYEHV